MKNKPEFARLKPNDTGRWMSCPPSFQMMHEAEEAFQKATRKTIFELEQRGCTVERHMPDEMVVTLPEGVTDFSEIENRIVEAYGIHK